MDQYRKREQHKQIIQNFDTAKINLRILRKPRMICFWKMENNMSRWDV